MREGSLVAVVVVAQLDVPCALVAQKLLDPPLREVEAGLHTLAAKAPFLALETRATWKLAGGLARLAAVAAQVGVRRVAAGAVGVGGVHGHAREGARAQLLVLAAPGVLVLHARILRGIALDGVGGDGAVVAEGGRQAPQPRHALLALLAAVAAVGVGGAGLQGGAAAVAVHEGAPRCVLPRLREPAAGVFEGVGHVAGAVVVGVQLRGRRAQPVRDQVDFILRSRAEPCLVVALTDPRLDHHRAAITPQRWLHSLPACAVRCPRRAQAASLLVDDARHRLGVAPWLKCAQKQQGHHQHEEKKSPAKQNSWAGSLP
mmetsp:Transcript_55356/g.129549  ORF Transcript_55356/g.129549 Transcript_55356/m.129549 type:complete len:316 (+) Transcript_55356:1-948(+)